jgi:hypothetical protein
MDSLYMETRKAILTYQFSERIKSELIIAFQLLEEMATLGGDDWRGAEKLMEAYLRSLLGEVRLAQGVLGSDHFAVAERKTIEAIGHLKLFERPEIYACLREAISSVTTSAQQAMEYLESNKLL